MHPHPAAMPLLSDWETAYIAQGIEQGCRTDGRGHSDYRPLEFELGLIPQASGSARLHLGLTDVLVCVKVELGAPEADHPDCGRLQVTVECSPAASPDFEGRGGEAWGMALAKAVQASLQGYTGSGFGVDLHALSIVVGRSCWVVHVDGLVLNDGGGVLAALSLAARAALASTRIPKVEVVPGEGSDDEPEIELDDDPSSQAPLDTSRVPVIITVAQVGNRCVVDLSEEEEPCASASLHVAVTPGGKVAGATKEGSQGVHPGLLQEMMELAQRVGTHLVRELDAYVPAALAVAEAGG